MDSLAIKHGDVPEHDQYPDAEHEESEDSSSARTFERLHAWLQHERERQAENRFDMAKDGDYYDGLQWDEQDAQAVEARGQAPLVYNETKVTLDWIIGTEKRNRVDWRVLPREASDNQAAAIKTKVLKYVSDVNRIPFTRSQAFAEAAICGLSWLEDSLATDATDDILYFGAESWRNVLHDSYHRRLDGRDMRYLFRWRHIDLDIAQAMFPEHADHLERMALEGDQLHADDEDELWYLGERLRNQTDLWRNSTRRYVHSSVSAIQSTRRRVKVYEAWYREPAEAPIVQGGAYHGEIFDPRNVGMQRNMQSGWCDVTPKTILRVRCAYMTEGALLEDYESPFKHNEFPFTPIYCFRRQRDGMAYGHVRPIRDPQMDLNKRMSKSLFLLSVNQLVTEKDAFDEEGEYTLQDAIDNAANPNGVFVLRDGSKKFEIRRDYAEVRSQLDLVSLDRQFMQSGSGVTDELLGRRTNATSGKAITARQEQGSTTTAGIFDNYRLAISLSGQKQLSNAEKFYTLPKVIRLTEPKSPENENSGLSWVTINEPEVQPDGSVRFLNDITATKADFIVDEQDFRASMRQSMFDSFMAMLEHIAPIAPTIAVGMLDMLIDLNDFPGKEEMVARAKQLVAEARGEPTSPEEAEEMAAQRAEQAELEKRAAAAKIAKDEAAADKTDAEADQIRITLPPNAVALDLERVPQQQALSNGARRVTVPGPDGTPITALIEPLPNGGKRITMPGPDGAPITTVVEGGAPA